MNGRSWEILLLAHVLEGNSQALRFAFMKWFSRVCALGFSVCVCFAEPNFATDKMSDDELREFRNRMRRELQRLLETAPSEQSSEGKVYRIYYCTIYYTPRESGFTAERGFDDTRVSAPGLQVGKHFLASLSRGQHE